MMLFAIPLFFLLSIVCAERPGDIKDTLVVYQWKQLSFGFPSARERQIALANGYLISSNGVPIDVIPYHTYESVKVLITIPRFQEGIPYSLAIVTEQRDANGPILQPYPNYGWHNSHGSNCDQITSAFRSMITDCDQLWIIDSGVIGTIQQCPPQLLVFDLKRDELVHRYRFNTTVYVPVASLLITPVIFVRDPPPQGRCQRVMAYIADVTHHGIVVYDSEQETAWRVENKFMYPDPDYGTHTIAGESFTLMDGIFGMSTDENQLYFHPLASINEYTVSLSVLNNRTNFLRSPEAAQNEFNKLGSRHSECAAETMDSRQNLYCVTLNPIKLVYWNVNVSNRTPQLHEVSVDPKLLEFVSGLKIVKNSGGTEELWMMSNRFQKIAAGTLNVNEINFRVIKRAIHDLHSSNNLVVRPNPDLNNKLIFN